MSSQRPLIYLVSLEGHQTQAAGSMTLPLRIGVKTFNLVLPPFSDDAITSVIFQLTTAYAEAFPEDIKLRTAEMGRAMAILVMQLGNPWDQGLLDAMTNGKASGFNKALRVLASQASPIFAMRASQALAAQRADEDTAVETMNAATDADVRAYWFKYLCALPCRASTLFYVASEGHTELREEARMEITRRLDANPTGEDADSLLMAIATTRDAGSLERLLSKYRGCFDFSRRTLDLAVRCNRSTTVKAIVPALLRMMELPPTAEPVRQAPEIPKRERTAN